MSHHITSAVFQCFYAGGNTRLIALALADACADESGAGIFLAVDTVAQMADVSRATVQRTMSKLLADGWLLRTSDNSGGRGRSNSYNINPDWITAVAVERARARQAGERAAKVFPTRPENDFSCAVTNPVDNPQKGSKLTPFTDRKRVANQNQKGIKNDVKGIKNGLKGSIAVLPEQEQEQNTNNTPLPPTGGASGFEIFIAAYPRRKGVEAARRQWGKLNPPPDLQRRMLAAIAAQAKTDDWQREAGRFVPMPSRWLAGHRWQDDTSAATPPPPAPTVLPPPVQLTPEQRAENKRRATELLTQTRAAIAHRAMQAGQGRAQPPGQATRATYRTHDHTYGMEATA